jgi:hypothetical protein
MQTGIPEWIATETYYANSSVVLGSNGNIYISLTDNNINHTPVGDTTNWSIVWSRTNDGTGSGLDADLVRGTIPGAGGLLLLTLSALSSVIPNMNGTANSGSSDIPARQDHIHPTDTTYGIGGNGQIITVQSGGIDSLIKGGNYIVSPTSSGSIPWSGYWTLVSVASGGLTGSATVLCVVQVASRYSSSLIQKKRVSFNGGASWSAWVDQWDSGNDGTGSGLDAGLLCGVDPRVGSAGTHGYVTIPYNTTYVIPAGTYMMQYCGDGFGGFATKLLLQMYNGTSGWEPIGGSNFSGGLIMSDGVNYRFVAYIGDCLLALRKIY